VNAGIQAEHARHQIHQPVRSGWQRSVVEDG